MASEKQKAARKVWSSTTQTHLARRQAWKAAQTKESWWTRHASDTSREGFQQALEKRQAERLAAGPDFDRGPQRAV